MVSKRPAKLPPQVQEQEPTRICYFTLKDGGDILDDEIIICNVTSLKGSLKTLYTRREHEFYLRSYARQLKLTPNDEIVIEKIRSLSDSWSTNLPYKGNTNKEF